VADLRLVSVMHLNSVVSCFFPTSASVHFFAHLTDGEPVRWGYRTRGSLALSFLLFCTGQNKCPLTGSCLVQEVQRAAGQSGCGGPATGAACPPMTPRPCEPCSNLWRHVAPTKIGPSSGLKRTDITSGRDVMCRSYLIVGYLHITASMVNKFQM
jgi:hypothetical protein